MRHISLRRHSFAAVVLAVAAVATLSAGTLLASAELEQKGNVRISVDGALTRRSCRDGASRRSR